MQLVSTLNVGTQIGQVIIFIKAKNIYVFTKLGLDQASPFAINFGVEIGGIVRVTAGAEYRHASLVCLYGREAIGVGKNIGYFCGIDIQAKEIHLLRVILIRHDHQGVWLIFWLFEQVVSDVYIAGERSDVRHRLRLTRIQREFIDLRVFIAAGIFKKEDLIALA